MPVKNADRSAANDRLLHNLLQDLPVQARQERVQTFPDPWQTARGLTLPGHVRSGRRIVVRRARG
ncbi:hypothetical protein GCM10010377_56230 [Streptomyces viridiviolaceus]|nr:hypothetical protein GCM10010377_56230 [Streptomyces viridiviolaceus]